MSLRTATRDVATLRRQLVLSTGLLALLLGMGLVVVVQFALGGAADDSVRRVLGDRADSLIASTDIASTRSESRVTTVVRTAVTCW